jgi:hypothetical protein
MDRGAINAFALIALIFSKKIIIYWLNKKTLIKKRERVVV